MIGPTCSLFWQKVLFQVFFYSDKLPIELSIEGLKSGWRKSSLNQLQNLMAAMQDSTTGNILDQSRSLDGDKAEVSHH